MKCPYCIANIDDTANACRYCGREVALLKAEQDRVKTLEQEITGLERQVSNLERRANVAESETIIEKYTHQHAHKETKKWRIVGLVALGILVPNVAEFVQIPIEESGFPEAIEPESVVSFGYSFSQSMLSFFSWVFPLIAGFWVALSWPEKHLKGYVLLGALVGLMQFLSAMIIVELLETLIGGYEWRWTWLYFSLAFLLEPALMFISGAFLGDTAKLKTYSPEVWMSGPALRLAQIISRVTGMANTKRLVGYIRYGSAASPGLIGPVLGFLAAFIAFVPFIGRVVFYYITQLY